MLRGAGSGPNLAAEAAWRLYVQQTLGTVATGVEPWRCSELMILYIGTRGSYSLEHELTVDYGKSYSRDYASGCHKATVWPLDLVPPEAIDASAPADWPDLPGWFNPRRQPCRRPAFEMTQPGGTTRVCADEPAIVAAQRYRNGVDGCLDILNV